ncbi:hypothetical protein ACOMHN_008441 [Nucella lapillus]
MADTEANGSSNVKVIVRVRPPNDLEMSEQRKNIIEIMNENILVFDPKEQSSPFHGRNGRRGLRDIRKRRQKDLKFAFDHVFGWTCSNMEVFEQSTRTVLDGLLGGYNCSVFAYGATGAGKTHTMLGKESNPGVIYHTMIHLYRHIAELSSEKTCDVAVSYLEVYNEQIRDLLMPHSTLPIREDHKTGVVVPGLSLHKPGSAEELLHMLHFGNQNRTQHPTDANAESSRSHAVFQVFVRQRDRTANISAQVKVAKMCLVDLAGSERATHTKNRGARFREGANINRSLLSLGNVINSLADHKSKGHIPYRDSKLTRLLKDSLGGNCRTIMIAAVSPSELSYEDTYNTLKYADRAKNIQLNMKKNVVSVDFHVSQYKKIVEDLHTEITELKSKLQLGERPVVNYAHSLCLPSNLQSLHENLQAAYKEHRAVRDQQLRQEINMRDTQWRLYRKHKCLRRATQLGEAQTEGVQKLQGVIEGLQRKVVGQETQRQVLHQQLQNNNHSLHALLAHAAVADNKASLYSQVSVDNSVCWWCCYFCQVLENSIQRMSLEVEVNDSQHYIHHLRRLARAQEQETVASETLISALLQLVQQQHCQLLRQGAVAPDIAASYRSVCELVGQWGVSWADGEGQHPPHFHINSIIDIPLLNNAGVPGSTKVGTDSVGYATPGQTGFTHNPASLLTSLPASAPPLTSGSCSGTSHQTLTAPPPSLTVSNGGGQPSSTAKQGGVLTDISHPNPHPPDVSRCGHSPATTVHAGHTPNPQKLSLYRTDAHEQWTASHVVSDTPVEGGVSRPVSRLSPSLNNTFSLDSSNVKRSTNSVASAVTSEESSLLRLPVIDSEPSLHAEKSAACTESVENRNGSSVKSDSRNPHHARLSSSVLGVQSHTGMGDNSQTSLSSTAAVMDHRQGTQIQGSALSVSPHNQENEGSLQRPPSTARRAINFDGNDLSSTPERVEVMSYADAVRTPTPTRQPLRTLDCNSSQFQATSLKSSGGEAETSRSSSCGSLYAVDSQALDNMRRLRELGLPSLVENLVTKSGGPECNKPRYMQATKATARRVRLQPMSKDDSFQPRRVPGKSLFHHISMPKSSIMSSIVRRGVIIRVI